MILTLGYVDLQGMCTVLLATLKALQIEPSLVATLLSPILLATFSFLKSSGFWLRHGAKYTKRPPPHNHQVRCFDANSWLKQQSLCAGIRKTVFEQRVKEGLQELENASALFCLQSIYEPCQGLLKGGSWMRITQDLYTTS